MYTVKKDIIKIAFLASIGSYIIRNTIEHGVSVIFIFLLYLLLFFKYSKVSFQYCFISLVISFGLKFVSEFFVVILIELAGVSIEDIFTSQILKIIVSCIPLTINLLIYLENRKKGINLLIKKEKRNNKSNNDDMSKYIIYILIFLSIVNMFIMSYMVKLASSSPNELYTTDELIIIFMITSSIFCFICLTLAMFALNKSKNTFKLENNLMMKNLKQMEETVDLLRLQKHDYMNHLQVILMQITSGKTEAARKYILGLSDCSKNNRLIFNTGNNYIDAILNLKNSRCLENNIELTACVDSLLDNTDLEDIQLSSILLNIIDNAIDELKKNNKSYKYIH